MRKKTSFLIDVGVGLLLTLVMAWAYVRRPPVFENLNLTAYDLLYRNRPPAAKDNRIEIVEIDEEAVTRLGRWPWPRAMVAQLVDDLVASGAKAIGLNVLFSEADQNPGLDEITSLQKRYSEILNKQKPVLERRRVAWSEFESLLDELDRAKIDLDGDAALTQSIEQAVSVTLPMYFQPGEALGNLDPLPAFFSKHKLTLKPAPANVPPGNAASLPLEPFGNAAVAIGHSNLAPDIDGRLRRIAPVMRYGDTFYPSFGLELVRQLLNLTPDDVKYVPSMGLSLRNAQIPLDENGMTTLDFAGPAGSFPRHSAVDVMTNALGDNAFANKIVLVGVTAPGTAPTFVGPNGMTYTGLEIWANHIANILTQSFVIRPPWAGKAEWGFFGLAAFVVLGALPFLRARFSMPIALVIFLGMAGASGILLLKKGFWISPAYATALLVAGFAAITGRRLIFTEKSKELVEAEGVETNKMLGLSFQGQGMLDLAFEKFRRCPVDDAMKELLYNLGLDMERKRQFSKAAAVYEHIATTHAGYKDIQNKIDLLKKAGEGAVFGSLGKKGNDATVVVEGLGQHTTLGRYEVMKELGRGAMGIVYLGKDPKINRQVAIKTLRFGEELDETQTKSVKERFFREAESAGNLTHPNIIRIFDAGEDMDVAYIAMELLDGQDLTKHCGKGALLPTARAIEIGALVAEGLDYAHKQGVVHRDIKPGNIMVLKDGTLRITDFGIARIQATSKTATGAVLGTPAYMSPEQVNGQKADGRADIFSLGVTLFELLTGEKPFYADTIPALLYRIANVDHPDPREFNPRLPARLVPIFKKALAKNPDQRYQTAGEMALDLRHLLTTLTNAAPAPIEALNPVVETPSPAPSVKTVEWVIPPVTLEPTATVPILEPPPLFTSATPATEKTLTLEPQAGTSTEDVFLNELEQAFNISAIAPGVAPEKPPVAVEQVPFIETTQNFNDLPKESPTTDGSEHNAHPPIPGTRDNDTMDGKGTQSSPSI